MGALLGAILGVGLLLIWRSGSRGPTPVIRVAPRWLTKRVEPSVRSYR